MDTFSLFQFVQGIILIFMFTTLFKNTLFLSLNPWYIFKERLRFYKNKKRWVEKNGSKPYNPKVSVVVPAWNEETGVVKTIESILANEYSNKEIVVVNDGSTDNTHEVIMSYINNKDIISQNQITYVSQKNGGKGVALNTGINHASGDIILTCDADSALHPDAIQNLVGYYLDPKIFAVVGKVEVDTKNNQTWVGLLQALEYQFGFYNKRAHSILGAEYIFGGACASFRKEVFERIGQFDELNKTEDIEMSMRVRAAGMNSTYAEDVICFTEGASEIPSLISQRVRWKKGRFDTFAKYKSMFFSLKEEHNFFLSFLVLPFSMFTELMLFFEPVAVTILLVYSFITGEFVSITLGISFILIVYIVGSLFSGPRKKIGYLLSFPFTWIIFYALDLVEYISLLKSMVMAFKGEEVVWQNWARKGLKG